jgi:CAAX prenyl protease-like protein
MSKKPMPAWLPYAGPFAVFLLMTSLESSMERYLRLSYPVAYAIKMAAVLLCLALLRPKIPHGDKPNGYGIAVATALGVLLVYIWILGDAYTPKPQWLTNIVGARRAGFDPYLIDNPAYRNLFLAERFFGLVVVVPLVEELFYRGFLVRFVADPDNFERIPVGKLTAASLLVNILFFASTHPEWLVAAIFSAAMCGLLARTKNVFACIWAHGVTNLLLGIWIMTSQEWAYW